MIGKQVCNLTHWPLKLKTLRSLFPSYIFTCTKFVSRIQFSYLVVDKGKRKKLMKEGETF